MQGLNLIQGKNISIHALREEGDAEEAAYSEELPEFLSTPSARRATVDFDVLFAFQCDFYPRPPRGGRRRTSHCLCSIFVNFYPRPPRGGRLLAWLNS